MGKKKSVITCEEMWETLFKDCKEPEERQKMWRELVSNKRLMEACKDCSGKYPLIKRGTTGRCTDNNDTSKIKKRYFCEKVKMVFSAGLDGRKRDNHSNIKCKKCGSDNVIKYGKTEKYKQRYKCNNCKLHFLEDDE